MLNRKTLLPFLLLSGTWLLSCNGNGQQPPLTPDQQAAKDRYDSLQKLVARTTETYKAMDIPSLLQKLAEQSKKQMEYFNSPAYRELQSRKEVDPKAIQAQISDLKNGDALLPLLLLRKLYPQNYLALPMNERVGILTDALSRAQTFNSWGLPHAYLQDASRALLECDSSAIAPLRRMLDNTRPAPVYGSKEHMEYMRYKYRLCDYALFFIESLRGNKGFVMPAQPEGRDSLIKGLGK
jgi:hypothetical protein